jgi:hypothetical protein
MLAVYRTVVFARSGHNDQSNRDRVKKKYVRKQRVLEKRSMHLLEQLNQEPDIDTKHKLSKELTHVCKDILVIHDTLYHLKMYYDADNGLEL